jgi:hypothetical protein
VLYPSCYVVAARQCVVLQRSHRAAYDSLTISTTRRSRISI